MAFFIVTNQPKEWPTQIDDVDVVPASEYLTNPKFSELRNAKVFNLSSSYRYQSVGYYVSLLAEARGHKPIPSIATIQDLKTHAIVRNVSEELDELIQKCLVPIRSDKFALSIYFGRNMAARYERLALHLYNQFQSPLLRAEFARVNSRWILRKINTISMNDVPTSHRPFLLDVAKKHFKGRGPASIKRRQPRFDIAILHRPDDPEPPSNPVALKKFVKAAEGLGMHAELITRDDYARLAEFDALFIRDTTFVDNYTYRFASRAMSEGLVVIDDPQSIVRCTNKVYLAELLARHKVPIPKTMVVHQQNTDQVADTLGFPVVLKKPDSSFSRGVVKVSDPAELDRTLNEFLDESELVVAQQFIPSTFDWRIVVMDEQPMLACKYYMARGHWQIIRQDRKVGQGRYGKSETIPYELAPRKAVAAAVKAANLIGDGLYGVDVKESDGQFYVIEVNDNPNIDAKCEDVVLKDELYRRIMQSFLRRIEKRKSGFFDHEHAR